MKFKSKLKGVAISLLVLSTQANASDKPSGSSLAPPIPVVKFSEVIAQKFNLPYTIKKVADGKQFYMVAVGSNVLYVTPDGNYVIEGSLFDVKKGVNLTELATYEHAKSRLKGMSEKHFIEYPAEKEEFVIHVFTDANCPYCQKFHNGVPELNKQGVTVKYIPFPLQGPGSKTYEAYTGILCSDSPVKNFEAAIKQVYMPPNKDCQKVLKEGIGVASELGVNSTPTIVLPNGAIAGGAYSPRELLPIIIQSKKVEEAFKIESN
jgi:thiol:disulfide interchange protein DsbC